MQGKNFQLDKEPLLNIPLAYEENDMTYSIKQNVHELLKAIESLLQEENGFNKWLKRTISPSINLIDSYSKLSFDEFLNKLKKDNILIKSREEQELLESEFNKSISIIRPIKDKIKEYEIAINNSVYNLYGLSADDITIVENSLNN